MPKARSKFIPKKNKGKSPGAPHTRKQVKGYMKSRGLKDKSTAKSLRHLGKLKNKQLAKQYGRKFK